MPTATALADPATTTGPQDLGSSLSSSDLTAPAPDFSTGTMGLPDLSGSFSNAPATNDSSATSANPGGLSSILSGLGTAASDVGSVLNSPIGTLGLLGGEYALIAGQANSTASQNNTLAGQISAIGQPDVTAGQNLLSSYTAGQLTAPYQAQLTAAQQANQNTATSQSQQVAQLLANSGGGQNVQSAQVSESGQIAAAQNLANTQAMSQAFLQELTDSLSLTQTGGAYVQAGIMQEIQSNTQLQQQLSALMGQLANAYAKSVAGSGSGTGTGAAGTGTGSGLGSIFNQAGKLLSGSSAGPDVSSLVSGANAGASAMGAGGAAALGSDVTGVDAQLAAGLNTSALTGAGTDPFSVEVGDLVQDPALGLGTDAASSAGSVASDAAGAVSDFSAGSAAAGAASSGLTAADLSVAAPDLAGIATPSAASLLGSGGAAAGAESAGAAAGTAGASSSAVASLAAVAAPVAAALGIGYLAYEGLATSTPDTIKTVGAGQSLTKLQSGDTALQEGAFAIGTGSSRGAGAGQQFIIPQTTTTIDGKTAQAGVPFALPDNFVTSDQVTIPEGKNGQPDLASVTYDPTATDPSAASLTALKAAANAQTSFGVPTGTPAQQLAYASAALSASYNAAGGQAAWGVPFQTWLQQTQNVRQNIAGEVFA